MADSATATATAAKQPIVKPEKPDDDKFKEDLAKLDKEHAAAQEKLVSIAPPHMPGLLCWRWPYMQRSLST